MAAPTFSKTNTCMAAPYTLQIYDYSRVEIGHTIIEISLSVTDFRDFL